MRQYNSSTKKNWADRYIWHTQQSKGAKLTCTPRFPKRKVEKEPLPILKVKKLICLQMARIRCSITGVKVDNKECYISDQEVSIERRKHIAFGSKDAKIGN